MNSSPKFSFNWPNFVGGGALLYAGGFFLIGRALVVLGIALSQAGWVERPAVVTEAGTGQISVEERTETTYQFAYEYTFDDVRYENNRYSAAQLSPSEREGVQRFGTGQQINVYVNPNNPDQAVVERQRPSLFVFFGLFLGGIFVWMATGLTFLGSIQGLNLLLMSRREASYRAFGSQYAGRLDDPPDQLIPEIAAAMPRSLKKILHRHVRNNNRAGGVRYLADKTGLPEPVCRAIIDKFTF